MGIPQPRALVVYWHAHSAAALISLAAAARELEDDDRAFRYAVTARALADRACEIAGELVETPQPPEGGKDGSG
jgi:hypothetical protein